MELLLAFANLMLIDSGDIFHFPAINSRAKKDKKGTMVDVKCWPLLDMKYSGVRCDHRGRTGHTRKFLGHKSTHSTPFVDRPTLVLIDHGDMQNMLAIH